MKLSCLQLESRHLVAGLTKSNRGEAGSASVDVENAWTALSPYGLVRLAVAIEIARSRPVPEGTKGHDPNGRVGAAEPVPSPITAGSSAPPNGVIGLAVTVKIAGDNIVIGKRSPVLRP